MTAVQCLYKIVGSVSLSQLFFIYKKKSKKDFKKRKKMQKHDKNKKVKKGFYLHLWQKTGLLPKVGYAL